MNIVKKAYIIIPFILCCVISDVRATISTQQIQEHLSSFSWKPIKTHDFVTFHPDRWAGESDLSFSYKIHAYEGHVYLAVQVHDDAVFLRDNKTIISDHVELWLIDSRLIHFAQDSIDFLKSDFSEAEDAEYWKEQAQILLPKYQQKYFCTQIIFNANSLFFALGHESKTIRHITEYQYTKTSDGYEFYARIPLTNTIDVEDGTLHEIAYLVDVVDIDAPDATQQKLLMSSSSHRQFADPTTFTRLPVTPSYVLSLPPRTEILTQVGRRGFLEIDHAHSTYQYMVEGHQVGDCLSFLEFPNYYHPLSFDIEYQDPKTGVVILAYDRKIAILHDQTYTIFDNPLDDAFVYMQALMYFQQTHNAYYLLLHQMETYRGSPCARGPCAGASFDSLLWLHLDSSFVLQRFEQLGILDSCGWESEGIPGIDEANELKYPLKSSFSGTWFTFPRETYLNYLLLFNEQFPEHGILDTFIGWKNVEEH